MLVYYPLYNTLKKTGFFCTSGLLKHESSMQFLVTCMFLIDLLLQNFDYIQYVDVGREGYYGGSVSLADYCPYIQEFTWRSKNVIVRGSHCQYAENNPSRLHCLLVLLFNICTDVPHVILQINS